MHQNWPFLLIYETEDDMKPSIEAKKKELASFYTHLKEPGYTLNGCTSPQSVDLYMWYLRLNAYHWRMKIPLFWKMLISMIWSSLVRALSINQLF